MSVSLQELGQPVRELARHLGELEQVSALLQLAPLSTHEWYASLRDKLLPQLGDAAFLIVAVTGGTNIGKSVVFNHIAGFRASSSCPIASGTRHPTCLLPPGFAGRHEMSALFPGFTLRSWDHPDGALDETTEHLLFLREAAESPGNLLILDTPDIDSDAKINWERADSIRRSSDVLVAVLTQQKYNDAAVKTFFRRAAAEDKLVVVVFNQVLLPEDEEYWPLWLKTFCDETGVNPDLVFVAPADRRAAESLALPFYKRAWPPTAEPAASESASTNLMDLLSRLQFDAIKLRTLRGSLAQLVARDGAPNYLQQVRLQAREFQSAADLLTAQELARIDRWPQAPAPLLLQTIRLWWQQRRTGWTRSVHEGYNWLGQQLLKPVSLLRDQWSGPAADPVATYLDEEWQAIVEGVEQAYRRLSWLAELGNTLLKPRLEQLLAGRSREALLTTLQDMHRQRDITQELSQLVNTEFSAFETNFPNWYQFFRWADGAAAAVRPGVTVALAVTGGHLVAVPALFSPLFGAATNVIVDVAAGATAATVVDGAVTEGAGQGLSWLKKTFLKIDTQFRAQRIAWLAQQLEAQLLGELTRDLVAGASLPKHPAFLASDQCVRDLDLRLRRLTP